MHTHQTARLLLSATLFTVASALPQIARAQEVAPEVTLGVHTLGSLVADFATGSSSDDSAVGVVDFSDTALLLRGRILLYPDWRGGAVFGLQFPDADSELGVVFFHQAFVFIEGRNLDVKIGRGRVQSSVVEFPTVRDDDLLPYTDSLNPYSSGTTTEDHQYGNVLEITGNINSQLFLSAHAEHMFLQPGDQGAVDFSLNSFGTQLSYKNIPARIDSAILREAGIGFNLYDAKGDSRAATWNLLAGAAFNLLPDPIHLVDLRAQLIYNNGDDGAVISTPNSTFRVRSLRIAAALRYLYSAGMIPTLQVAAIGGYARYGDGEGSSWSVALNGMYSLGANFDLGVQYQIRSDDLAIRTALGTPEFAHTAQIVLRFGYELTTNALPDRDSILNNEHGYIP